MCENSKESYIIPVDLTAPARIYSTKHLGDQIKFIWLNGSKLTNTNYLAKFSISPSMLVVLLLCIFVSFFLSFFVSLLLCKIKILQSIVLGLVCNFVFYLAKFSISPSMSVVSLLCLFVCFLVCLYVRTLQVTILEELTPNFFPEQISVIERDG